MPPPGPFVRPFQRIGTTAGLVPAETALVLDPAFFALSDQPNAIVTDASGGEVVGYTLLTGATGASSGVTGGTPGAMPSFSASAKSIDATTKTLFTIAIPAAGMVRFWIRVLANLGDGPNQNGWPSVFEGILLSSRQGTGAPALASNDSSIPHKPFIENQGSATAGGTNTTVSGNNLLIQATGFAPPSAWQSGHAYVTGDGANTPGSFVTANGNVYVCSTGGTSSGSAPSGTGTGLGTGALFDCVAVGKSYVPITWTGLLWAFSQG